MEASPRGSLKTLIVFVCLPFAVSGVEAATRASELTRRFKTPNFIVSAPSTDIARQVAIAAEGYRDRLAVQWLGRKLPRWSSPCNVRVLVGRMGAGGYTTFKFDRGRTGKMEVFGWDMTVQGPLDRILDSVLPHEVSHTIFACHFRKPLPRWADEGAATLAEDDSEKRRQRLLVNQVLGTSRRIPLRQLLPQTEYPKESDRILVLYAEGFSLADYLVQQGGRTKYLKFLGDAIDNGWDAALRRHYNYRTVEALESRWTSWVAAGSPTLKLPKGQLLASNQDSRGETSPAVIRSQTPDSSKRAGTTRSRVTDSKKRRPWNGISALRSPGFGHSRPYGLDLVAPKPPRTRTSSSNVGWEVVADTGLYRDPFLSRSGLKKLAN